MDARSTTWVVWRFSDGKPGHDAQSLGLAEALARQVTVELHDLQAWPCGRILRALALGRAPPVGMPPPHLLLGAGHGTHLSLLAARRTFGGHAIVLMRPSLPWGWFDLCVVPEHDAPPRRANVFVTRGVLNRVRAAPDRNGARGMVLIGGPSAHFRWDGPGLLHQVQAVLAAQPQLDWTVTTSRRTPTGFELLLQGLRSERVRVVPGRETDSGWLPRELGRAAVVWVSEDSVSMVYEALSSGAAVGVLELPPVRRGRVVRGLRMLIDEGLVTPFGAWQRGASLRTPERPFNEADRIAREVIDWLA